MSKKTSINRRKFIVAAGAATAALNTNRLSAKSYLRIKGANARLGVGVIGAGGMGSAHIETIAKQRESENLDPIAVADCWKTRADKGATAMGAPTFTPTTVNYLSTRKLTTSQSPRLNTGIVP